jgi:hypothetical protein
LSAPRIVYAADLNEYSRALARLRAFEDLGLEVRTVNLSPVGDAELGYAHMPLGPRLLAHLGFYLDWVGAGAQILRALESSDADLVWIDKGPGLSPGVLRRIKRRWPDVKLVMFSEDDLFLAHNRTPRVTRNLPLYDVVFTTKGHNVANRELESLGARKVAFVYQAFDPYQHHPIVLSPAEMAEFSADVSFIGSYEDARARSLLHLAANGVAVRVWGNGWDQPGLRHDNLRIEARPLVNRVGRLDFSKGISGSRINLCFLRKRNRDQHTSRSFEIPAVGGFMLAERTDEHLRLYREDVEAAFFGDDDELLEKVRFYLAHDAVRRDVAAAGHARCVSQYGSLKQADIMIKTVFAEA